MRHNGHGNSLEIHVPARFKAESGVSNIPTSGGPPITLLSHHLSNRAFHDRFRNPFP